MGKKKKKEEKKGKAKDKAVLKAEKKAAQRSKKEGEEDLDAILAEIKRLDQQRTAVTETKTSPPSPRCHCSLVAHPERQELLLFGGEFFNGQTSHCYNDLFVYNIRKDEWVLWQIPNPPPPRCSHQAVAVPQGGGQMWVFGGEFVSPKAEQFHHFKDLWMLSLVHSRWEKINSPGGPSSRSGHRMVATKHFLVVFGGFHESIRDFIYFNDVHTFSLDTHLWQRLSLPAGPNARSAACLSTSPDGGVLVFGGYSRQRVKREVEKGTIHPDMWVLSPVQDQPVTVATSASASKKPTGAMRWKWQKVSPSGRAPSPRSGATMIQFSPQRALLFGGVEDEESDEMLESLFSNDLFQLATDGHPPRWFSVEVAKGSRPLQRRRKTHKIADDAEGDKIEGESEESIDEDDESAAQAGNDAATAIGSAAAAAETPAESQAPIPRMNAALAVKGSTLFVYGGMYEQGDRQVFLDDMYAVDVGRRGGWRVLVPLRSDALPWLEKEDDDDDEDEEEDEEEDEKQDQAATAASSTDEEEDEDDVANQPPSEKFGEFFIRTKESWLELARTKLADNRPEAESSSAAKDDDSDDEDEVSVRRLAFQLAETHFRTLQEMNKTSHEDA